MANGENEGIMSTEGLVTNRIRLHDGTVLNLPLNGTEYESAEPIADSVLSKENLSNVVIDGVAQGKMVLVSKYPFHGGTRFCIRQQTAAEKESDSVQEQLEASQLALAELYEMIIG